jgi:hypothetical protein
MDKEKHKLKVKGWKKDFSKQIAQNEAEILAIFTSDK